MIRQMVLIDESKCIGCGLCANACKESAIEIVNGKAHLVRDDYCDGLGNCLPACPVDAISLVEREAEPYNELAVKHHQAMLEAAKGNAERCPGARMRVMDTEDKPMQAETMPSQLRQWPVQIKLAGIKAPYYEGCRLLLAADCTAYAYGAFHEDFIRGHVTLIGCPKLDEVDYAEKLGDILRLNDVRAVLLARMEVPCCGGLQRAAERAIAMSGKQIPLEVVVIGTDGSIVSKS